MRGLGILLTALGRQGPLLLVGSLIAGAFSRELAQIGYAILPFSAFLLTLGSFLTAGLSPAETKTRLSLLLIVLVWVGVGVPLAATSILSAVHLDPSLRAGVLLSFLAPPVGSAAAIAAMLGLQPRLALVASIVLTLLAPLAIPFFANLIGLGVTLDASALALRLLVIIGAAALISLAALRFRSALHSLLPDQRAGTGVAVIGLIIVGLATSQGIRTQWISDPAAFERMLGSAVAFNLGMCVVGTMVFWWLGGRMATTIGLVSGNRNVTLAWAAAGFGLPPVSEGYLAACVVPVLALPLVIKLCLSIAKLGIQLSMSRSRDALPRAKSRPAREAR